MGKSSTARLGILAVMAFALLMAGNYYMSTNQGSEFLIVTFPSGHQLKVEVADTPLILRTGLAFRDPLPPGWGLVLIYEHADFYTITTQHYRFPVDLVWLDEAKRVIFIAENLPPCEKEQCPLWGPPPEKARYIIAAPTGLVQQEHLAVGVDLRFALQM